ncbi:hypothetical protein G7072_04225 [Nocardioides sp. HDW12B]|uniref:hypothetical protein n=1 Tax=Nocardioides sp. HDW12B TaxID=2714939 RepID=UPI001407B06D|nr:hypothetical protein [Nocardioides sp. HDW12B]QIK65648.1 hypothetical protein G7072_04225 [Nocardioides sp. HDW12B]
MRRRPLVSFLLVVLLVVAVVQGKALLGHGEVPVGQRAAPPSALVYAVGRELVVDGERHTLEREADSLVSTEGGIYYLSYATMWRWSPEGDEEVADLGGVGDLKATADGRYLGYVDYEHGPWTVRGDHVAEVVVVDTASGETVLRDTTGNGSRTDDVEDAYAEVAPAVLGFDDDRHVFTRGGVSTEIARVDLDGDLVVDWQDRPVVADDSAGGTPVGVTVGGGRAEVDDSVLDRLPGRASPDGARVVFEDEGVVSSVDAAGGVPERVVTGSAYASVGGWLDDTTFVVVARDLEEGAPSDTAAVLTCAVGGGCSRVDGPTGDAEHAVVLGFGGLPS